MPRAPFVAPVGEAAAELALEAAAELDAGEEAALLVDALPAAAAFRAAVMSMGNLMGLPPADMSTLPSAPRTSGFSAKRVCAYLYNS